MVVLGFFLELNEQKIEYLKDFNSIDKTKPSSIVVVDFNINDIKKYSSYNNLLGVVVKSIKEFIIVANCEVLYAVCEYELSKTLQKIAENYMYDTKVISIIDNEDSIEQVALDGIDGVINRDFLC